MKAIAVHQFGEPDVMKLEEVPTPQPSENQILVRVKAVGINPVETYIRAGIYGSRAFPYTPGTDGAGLVEAVGAGVTRFSVGDRVYLAGSVSGTYAEFALCNASQIYPLPDNVSYAQGAAVNIPYATAYRALFHRAQAVPGETIFIHGASGGVGIAALQLAKAAGMTTIGTASTEKGQHLVREQGANYVLNHHAPDYLQQVLEITAGQGVNVILEMLANVNLGKDLGILSQGGRVVVIGSRGSVEINPRDTMSRDAAILGMSLLNTDAQGLASIHAALVAGLGNGTLHPIVGQEMPLADAPRAHLEVMESGAYGKIVLIP